MKKNDNIVVCIDVETTGLNTREDRIIQMSMVRFNMDNGETLEERDWYIKPTGFYDISESAQKIHGISKEFIEENGVSIKSIFNEFMSMKEGCSILTFNGTTFDISFIEREMERERLDPEFYNHTFIDSYHIEKKVNANNLSSTYKRYFGEVFEDAHNSLSDVKATIRVFMEQRKKFVEEVEESIAETTLNSKTSPEGFCFYDKNNELCFRYGKYKEIPVTTVCQKDPSYIKWLFTPNNGDNVITIPTKRAIKKEWEDYKQRKDIAHNVLKSSK